MKKVYLIGNSHIDPVWLWDYREGIDEVISTFQSACDRLDEYPEMCFTAGSAQFYKWVEEFAPRLFRRIRKHVETGRWEITGDWWIEPDCNLPIEASFIRHMRAGKTYLRSKFGVETTVGYNPDSFGHSAALPGLLAGNGYKYYVFCRPNAAENQAVPDDLFYWEYEHSRVLCYRIPYHYTTGWDPELFRRTLDTAIANPDFLKRGLAAYFYGVGNHGGGPTIAEIEHLIKKREEARSNGVELVFSTLAGFLAEAEKCADIPVFRGDLHMHAVGCYSVNRAIKEAVRNAEYAALTAERTLGLNSGTNASLREKLDQAWEPVLFNEFHDILPGSCTRRAAEEAVRQLAGARAVFDGLTYHGLKELTENAPSHEKKREYHLWNTLPWKVKGAFEIETLFDFFTDMGLPERQQYSLVNENGREISYQVIPGASAEAISRRLIIDEIPAGGYRTYHLVPGTRSDHHPSTGTGPSQLENTRHRITLGANGLPNSIVIKESGDEALAGPVRLLVLNDPSDTWGHGMRSYDDVAGEFRCAGIPRSITGEHLSAVHTHQIYSDAAEPESISRSSVETRLYPELSFIEFRIHVLWNRPGSLLKMEIPFIPGIAGRLIAQVPGGRIARSMDGAEAPLQGWIRMDGYLNPAICQKGAYAYDCENGRVRITLVRSSLYGYNKWPNSSPHPVALYHTDLGEHEFTVRLYLGKPMENDALDRVVFEMYEPFLMIAKTVY